MMAKMSREGRESAYTLCMYLGNISLVFVGYEVFGEIGRVYGWVDTIDSSTAHIATHERDNILETRDTYPRSIETTHLPPPHPTANSIDTWTRPSLSRPPVKTIIVPALLGGPVGKPILVLSASSVFLLSSRVTRFPATQRNSRGI